MIKCYRLANYVHVSNFQGQKIDSFLVTLTKYVCTPNHSTIISNINYRNSNKVTIDSSVVHYYL